MRAPVRLLLLLGMVASAGCGPTVDLTKGLQILDVQSGWFDAGIVDGKNKLVPAITLKLKNVSDQKLVALQLNAVFRRVDDPKEWGNRFLRVVGSAGLPPGATTAAITLRSDLGYTGTEPRLEMLHNSNFVDAKVEVSAKYGPTQWVRIGDFPIKRELIAQ
jgi:hypothetical protein